MKKAELLGIFRKNADEIESLQKRIEQLRQQNSKLLNKYAEEKAREAGWTFQKVLYVKKGLWDREKQRFTQPQDVPYFYHHAWADPHNGNVFLEFTRAKKDGTPSKVVCHNEYLVVND